MRFVVVRGPVVARLKLLARESFSTEAYTARMLTTTRISRKSLIAGAAASCAIVPMAQLHASAAQFTWKWAIDLPPTHSIVIRSIDAFAKIRADTNGQLDIQAFPNSALGSNTGSIEQLRAGSIEMVATGATAIESMVPVGGIENVAFAFPSRKVAFAAEDGDLGALFRDGARAQNIYVSDRVFDLGYRQFTTSTKPVRTVTDLDGLKLRVSPGKIRTDTFRSLGCSPVTIEPGELYVALQTHLADGMESSLSVIESYKVFEVQRYCSLTNHMWSGYWTLINLDKWSALPSPFQQIVRNRLNEAAYAQRNDNLAAEGQLRATLEHQGLAFNTTTPDSFRARLTANGYYARWRVAFGDQAWTALEKYCGPLR